MRNPFRRKKNNEQLASWFLSDGDNVAPKSYRRLSDCPEVQTAVNTFADLISDMTIQLMANTDKGDKRIKNALSRKVDIHPYKTMTRKNLVFWIVKKLMLEGNAVIFPKYARNGHLEELIPITNPSFIPDGDYYKIRIGSNEYRPDEVVHFVFNPALNEPWQGKGFTVELKDVMTTLKQSNETRKDFLTSKFNPSLIIGVNALSGELGSQKGRIKFAEKYGIETANGKPWFIPAEIANIEQVKPLTLNDLAINDSVVIDKKAIAGIFGVPAYFLGIGEFDRDEHNNFIRTKVMSVANIIQQTLTAGLLISDKMYFQLNARSLYAYDIDTMSTVGANLYTRGIMTGNEVRNWMSLPPMDGLDELIILENYIPQGMIGDQKKLNQEGNK